MQVSEEIEELKRNIAKYELVETATHAEKLILLENLLEMRKEKNLLLREQCEQKSVDACQYLANSGPCNDTSYTPLFS